MGQSKYNMFDSMIVPCDHDQNSRCSYSSFSIRITVYFRLTHFRGSSIFFISSIKKLRYRKLKTWGKENSRVVTLRFIDG